MLRTSPSRNAMGYPPSTSRRRSSTPRTPVRFRGRRTARTAIRTRTVASSSARSSTCCSTRRAGGRPSGRPRPTTCPTDSTPGATSTRIGFPPGASCSVMVGTTPCRTGVRFPPHAAPTTRTTPSSGRRRRAAWRPSISTERTSARSCLREMTLAFWRFPLTATPSPRTRSTTPSTASRSSCRTRGCSVPVSPTARTPRPCASPGTGRTATSAARR